ncbi:MAG: glutamate racemase, partial [Ruminococcus sp.]
MKRDAIGVFDSGMGGLTAVKELNRILPHENIIYFGDTARVPYGSRSPETVWKYAQEDVAFLRKYSVKMIIAACGTVSSIVGNRPLVQDMPFTGVIYPTVDAACAATKTGRIGVIGTPATVRSSSYQNAILERNPDLFVIAQACPLFVH